METTIQPITNEHISRFVDMDAEVIYMDFASCHVIVWEDGSNDDSEPLHKGTWPLSCMVSLIDAMHHYGDSDTIESKWVCEWTDTTDMHWCRVMKPAPR